MMKSSRIDLLGITFGICAREPIKATAVDSFVDIVLPTSAKGSRLVVYLIRSRRSELECEGPQVNYVRTSIILRCY
jgi:hypothetical protein